MLADRQFPTRFTGRTNGTGENIRLIEQAGIRAYVALADYEQSSPFYRQRDFTYAAARDVFTCPQGATLRFRGNNDTTRVRSYQAPVEAGAACPARAHCTDSTTGRRVERPHDRIDGTITGDGPDVAVAWPSASLLSPSSTQNSAPEPECAQPLPGSADEASSPPR